jgi:hypothetical protein
MPKCLPVPPNMSGQDGISCRVSLMKSQDRAPAACATPVLGEGPGLELQAEVKERWRVYPKKAWRGTLLLQRIEELDARKGGLTLVGGSRRGEPKPIFNPYLWQRGIKPAWGQLRQRLGLS